MILKISVCALLVVSSICAAAIEAKSHDLVIKGAIDQSAYKKIHEFLVSGGETIHITSEAGSVEWGQKIGMEMASRNTTLIVEKYCLSSCANYLFLSSEYKILSTNSVLGFHGGISLAKREPTGNVEPTGKIKVLTILEGLLFDKLKIDHGLIDLSTKFTRTDKSYITVEVFGTHGAQKKFPDDQLELAAEFLAEKKKLDPTAKYEIRIENEINNVAFFPSKATLIKHGVTGILDYPYPETQLKLDALATDISDDLRVVADFPEVQLPSN